MGKTEVINDLNHLKYDWDGEILKEIVHSCNFKVRHAWFQRFIFVLDEIKNLYESNLIVISFINPDPLN